MENEIDVEKGVSKKQERLLQIMEERFGEKMKQEITEQAIAKTNEFLETRIEELSKKIKSDDSDAPPLQLILSALQQAGFENDPEALRLLRQARGQGAQAELRMLADLAGLALRRLEKPAAKGSTVILPSGGGLPAPDLRAEYEKRVGQLRGGDVAGLMEAKREFRKRGLQVW